MDSRVLWIIVLIIYAAFNLYVSKVYSMRQMKESFVDGQCAVGRVFTNMFYAPAWILKVFRALVVMLIK